jgi:ligand-binding sensor domain-containing protein
MYHIWLVSLLLAVISCNQQEKIPSPAQVAIATASHPKLTKTQGSNEYATIHCSYLDKNGNLWFGTSAEGVYRYDGKLFTQFTVKDGLNTNAVFAIIEDRSGVIWFGSTDGLCHYDGKTISRVPITASTPSSDTGNDQSFYYNEQSTKKTVWSILQDKTGRFWFGTGEGVYCYDGKQFTRFPDSNTINKSGLHLKLTDCIFEDKKGNIWFCSGMMPGSEGISRFDGTTLENFKPYNENWVRAVLEDRNGNLLFATRHMGILRYDGQTFTNITKKAGIDNGSVWSMVEDRSGNIWIGTENGSGQLGEDGGLWRFDGISFTKFTTKDGLVHNGVSSLLEDRNGNIWVGSRNTGLCRYVGKTFVSFSE